MADTYLPRNKRTEGNSTRNFAGNLSRAAKRAAYNLGIIGGSQLRTTRLYRDDRLAKLDSYYDNTVYDNLMDWESANREGCEGEYIPIRDRKPKIIINLAKVFAARVASKLTGKSAFPKFNIEDDPDTANLVSLILRNVGLQARLAEPMRRMVVAGSVFVRFWSAVNDEGQGTLKVEHYCSKYCYPEFDSLGELVSVEIKYVYSDMEDLDEKGAPRKKWYRLVVSRDKDILYDNPVYSENSEPIFQEIDVAEHNLGYVQGEWFRTAEDQHSPDGPSLIEDSISLIDDINYSASQSSQAVSYNQEPQTIVKGMDAEELDQLVRSSNKAWNLGRDGEATFLESDLGAVKTAMEMRDKSRLAFQDVSRIALHDPEKLNANALSGKAMEILHTPFVELMDEIRAIVEPQLISLVLKIVLTILSQMQQGADFGIVIPQGYSITSLNLTPQWPPVFPMTMADIKEKVSVGIQASNANILSRETVMRWVAKDFGVEDIEEELAKIAAQPVINPFGAF